MPGWLPTWLKFNTETKVISGLPGRQDLVGDCPDYTVLNCSLKKVIENGTEACVAQQRCTYRMRITVTDEIDTIAVLFNITVINYPPYVNSPIYAPQARDDLECCMKVHLNQLTKYYLNGTGVRDEDPGDRLTYSA